MSNQAGRGDERRRQTTLMTRGSNHRRGGRPLVAGLSEAVLDAAVDVLADSGFAGLTMEAIAARASVGKPAIYRRWATKEALVEEAVLRAADSAIPIADTGSLRGDCIATLRDFQRSFEGREGRILTALVAEAVRDPDWEPVVVHLQERRRVQSRVIVDRAVRRGELAPDVDADLLIDLLAGPFWLRALTWHNGRADPTLVERVVDKVLAGFEKPH